MKAINYYIVIDKIKEAPKKIGGIELITKMILYYTHETIWHKIINKYL